MMKTLSIIIPVYNEEKTIKAVADKVNTVSLDGVNKEIIVVNDGSTDNTANVVGKIKFVKFIDNKINHGKGHAIRTGIKSAKGHILLIQDADLEYDPNDYQRLLEPILSGKADVVYGSRFVGHQAHRVLYFWHSVGNSLLTIMSNMLTNLNLTDMETGYKVFTKEIADKLILVEDRFGFEPEFTAKVSQLNARIYEVGISYFGRSYQEGKKINWKDGMRALWCIAKYNFDR